MNENKSRILIIAVISLFSLCGCDYWKTLTRGGDRAFVIKGTKTISGQTIEFKPGTRVRFEAEEVGTVGGTVSTYGELVLTNGARLIARGTPDNPIVFETNDSGGLRFGSDADSNSVMEYCKFESKTYVHIKTSIKIEYCKFNNIIEINLSENAAPLIEYNTFENDSSIATPGNCITSPIIRYNDFRNSNNEGALTFSEGDNPTIEFNNIVNCKPYAIFKNGSSKLTVSNNYIVGSQNYNVIDQRPEGTPVSEAGCGW